MNDKTRLPMFIKIFIMFFIATLPVSAQTAVTAATNLPGEPANATPEQVQGPSQTNRDRIIGAFEHAEKVRASCIEGRRLICGKILEILPEGLVVESGYTNLLRKPLTKSWLAPGTVEATRAENMLEQKHPSAVCVGLVFLTDTPRKKNLKPKQYDYVIIEGFPAGQYTYQSLGTIERTVRKFSANLGAAVGSNLQAKAQ
jgi:hypothetical protein